MCACPPALGRALNVSYELYSVDLQASAGKFDRIGPGAAAKLTNASRTLQNRAEEAPAGSSPLGGATWPKVVIETADKPIRFLEFWICFLALPTQLKASWVGDVISVRRTLRERNHAQPTNPGLN